MRVFPAFLSGWRCTLLRQVRSFPRLAPHLRAGKTAATVIVVS